MSDKLLTEHHLEFLCLKGYCTGSSESTHVKMPHCWKSHGAARFCKSDWYPYSNLLSEPVSSKRCKLVCAPIEDSINLSIRTVWSESLIGTMRGSRVWSGHTPLKTHKNGGFLSNTGPDPLKNHKACIQSWAIIGSPVKRHLDRWWPSHSGIWILSSTNKKRFQSWNPSAKTL